MSELSQVFEEFIKRTERNKEAKELLKERDQVFQFDLTDDKPFYVEMKGEKISVTEGTSSLDWDRKNWQEISCIWTDKETVKAVMKGEKSPMEANVEGRWSFSCRVGKKAVHRWFCNLLRLAREQIREEGLELLLSKRG